MLAEAEILPPETQSTDLVIAVANDPGIVLLDDQKFSVWYDKLKASAPTDANVETSRGRDTLRAYAAKVRSEKAAIDKARLRLTAEWRDATAQANAAGKKIAEQLESLAVEVRAPLTEWEDAEKARVERCRAVIDRLKADRMIREDDTADTVRDRGMAVYETAIDAAEFGDMFDEAEAVKAETVATLKRALDRLTREEAERAELEKLRAAEADRLMKEAQEREARESAEREAALARAAEEQAADAAEAEKQRVAEAAERAAQDARDEAARVAAEAEAKRAWARKIIEHIQEVGRGMIGGQSYPYGVLIRELEEKIEINDELGDMQGEVAAVRDATLIAVKAAMEAQGERTRREERERKEREEAQAAHERAENKANRARVKTAAKQAIMTCGVSEDAAQKVVLAIIAGEIPNTVLSF